MEWLVPLCHSCREALSFGDEFNHALLYIPVLADYGELKFFAASGLLRQAINWGVKTKERGRSCPSFSHVKYCIMYPLLGETLKRLAKIQKSITSLLKSDALHSSHPQVRSGLEKTIGADGNLIAFSIFVYTQFPT